jgi:uncharacterized protein (TIGR02145 family)
MNSKVIKGIAFLIIVAAIFVKGFIKLNKGETARNPTPKETAESVSESTENLLGQEIDLDTFYLPAPSYKNIGNRTWTAANLGIFIAKNLDGYRDTLGVMTRGGALFTLNEALVACPSGFRVPRKEEFQSRDVEELGVGTWWTSNVVDMYTTERQVEGSGYPERTNHVFAAIAQVSESSRKVSISETNIRERHSVLCISDKSEPIVTVVSDMPDKITTKSGTIAGVQFEPHYNRDGLGDCCDCCCHEGSGGVLQIQLRGDDGSIETDTVYEFGEYPLCILPGYEAFATTGAPDSATCINPEMGNLNMLSLFQKGAYVKSERCRYNVYETGWDDVEYISGYSCGDTLTVSFTGVLRDIQPVSDEYITLCTYKILNPETEDVITTTHECKGVMIGSTYRVKATVTYTDDSFGIRIPAVRDVSYFLCCNGRSESRGDEYSRLDFELVEE